MFIIVLAKLISVSLHKFQLPLSGTTEVKRRSSERSLLLPVGGGGMGRGGGVCMGRGGGLRHNFWFSKILLSVRNLRQQVA